MIPGPDQYEQHAKVENEGTAQSVSKPEEKS